MLIKMVEIPKYQVTGQSLEIFMSSTVIGTLKIEMQFIT